MRKKYYRTEHRQSFYKEEIERCGGRCMICGKEDRLVIDHDHKTGIIRGLLCYKHNTGLGMFEDDIEILKRTIQYLEERGVIEPPKLVPSRKEAINQIITELCVDSSFKSDRARGRELARRLKISEDAAQARVKRHRKSMPHPKNDASL